MRSVAVLGLEAARATPDLTRYLAACGAVVAALLALAWAFRRFLAGHVKARAAKRSLQVLDVLPLSGKQKLVVVRCYDRSFLLGVGEKEVRSIAELDLAAEPRGPQAAPAELAPPPVPEPRASEKPAFADALERELVVPPAPPRPARTAADLKGGILA